MYDGSVWGKIIGGLAGFMAAGPVGALFGTFAGHGLDRLKDSGLLDRLLPAAPEGESGFTIGIVVLAAKMARADGAVTEAEAAAFRRIFHIPQRDAAGVARLFAAAGRDPGGFEPYAEQIAEMFADSRSLLEELLEALVIVGSADAPLSPAEVGYLRRIAAIFGIPDDAIGRLLAHHDRPRSPDPYHLLGVAPGAAAEDIKAAYRRLVRENHPDTLIAKGLPKEFVDIATRKLAAINNAYEHVKKDRGIV